MQCNVVNMGARVPRLRQCVLVSGHPLGRSDAKIELGCQVIGRQLSCVDGVYTHKGQPLRSILIYIHWFFKNDIYIPPHLSIVLQ